MPASPRSTVWKRSRWPAASRPTSGAPSSVLAELHYGHGRLTAYVRGDSCAIVAVPEPDGAGAVPIHLVAKRPAGGEGSDWKVYGDSFRIG
ncbi:hypothetical protein [Streptomyces sp. NPDC090021]|uniref:hypothetical protein n=1 Tax=Streptomyces sp. NPDC090021 TaxID=3365919 RepID=UPI00382A9032